MVEPINDVTWTILIMSLLPFWALNVSVVLLSMEDQKALGFHQKYLNLCSEDEWRSYRFGTTWGWAINDRFFIFGWTIPLSVCVIFCSLELQNWCFVKHVFQTVLLSAVGQHFTFRIQIEKPNSSCSFVRCMVCQWFLKTEFLAF